MKLRNRKTGEIIEFDAILPVKDVSGDSVAHLEYGSIAELNEEWEDAPEEPKEYWTISGAGYLWTTEHMSPDTINDLRRIGNLFETKEEAELAVRKLEAWKRLKDKGFKFNNFIRDAIYYEISDEEIEKDVVREDLDLLFRGKE